MARTVIGGQPALDRDGVAELTGKAKATVKYWALNRDETGFPPRCNPGTTGKEWYRQSEVEAFWEQHQQAKHDALTEIDRSGDPDELVTAPQVLGILRYGNNRKLPAALLDDPDDTRELPSGRLRRRWYRRTVWAWADDRISDPAGGRPVGTSTQAPAPYQYANDARLPELIVMLEQAEAEGRTRGLGYAVARHLGVDESTASRLLAAARQARQA